MEYIRVVIADPHPLIVRGLSSVLEAQREFKVVARCSDVASCIEAIRMFKPHITIVGISMPGSGELDIVGLVNSEDVSTRVVLFATGVGDRDLQRLAGTGAYAVLPQDVDLEILVQVLRQVAHGRRPHSLDRVGSEQQSVSEKSAPTLTDRERQIMRLVSEGLSNKEIGRRLNLTDGTIKVHLHHIFQKLELSNRTALAAFAMTQDDQSDSPVDD